jgi:hypothetical protein
MAKWKLTAQDKNKIRNKDEVLVDLHFHLGKQESLREPLNKLSRAVDVISITGRGHRFENIFEYDFVSFLNQLKSEHIPYTLRNDVLCEISLGDENLDVIKSQEIHTREGFDVVIIGSQVNFGDDISINEIISRAKNSIVLLSTTFQIPNSIKTRPRNDYATEQIAKITDAIEMHNQSLFFNKSNAKAHSLSLKIDKPGIAVSDHHLYSKFKYPLNLSGIIIRRSSSKENFVGQLKNNLLAKKFTNYCVYSIYTLFEFFTLSPRNLRNLFYGKKL